MDIRVGFQKFSHYLWLIKLPFQCACPTWSSVSSNVNQSQRPPSTKKSQPTADFWRIGLGKPYFTFILYQIVHCILYIGLNQLCFHFYCTPTMFSFILYIILYILYIGLHKPCFTRSILSWQPTPSISHGLTNASLCFRNSSNLLSSEYINGSMNRCNYD